MFSIFHAPRQYPEVYARYYDQFNFYEGRDVWLQSIADIPAKSVHLFCVHWLHLEVYNGGFSQYFYNSTSTSAPEARDGFRAIGMEDVAAIVDDAMLMLGTPFPFEKAEREALVGYTDDLLDFGKLDSAFYELADTDKIFRRKPRFVDFADAYALVG